MDDLHVHWKGKQGDFLYVPDKDKVYVAYMTVTGEFFAPEEVHFYDDKTGQDSYSYIGDYVPLFRQDQLQTILGWNIKILTDGFHTFFLKRQGNSIKYDTLEKAWLAFLMQQDYHKVWNGEDWVSA